MPAYTITTVESVVQAAIIGTVAGLDRYLKEELVTQGLSSEVLELEEITNEYRYYFVPLRLSKKSIKKLQAFVQNQNLTTSRVTIIVTETPNSTETFSYQEKIHQLVSTLLSQKVDSRIVYLHDLYGPEIKPSQRSLVGQIFRGVVQGSVRLTAEDEFPVYPLHVDDAVAGIIKATFTRNSNGKVYELAGKSLTLLNFAYKIRSLTKNTQIRIEDDSKSTQYERPSDRIIELTQEELRWSPSTELLSGLKETLSLIPTKEVTPESILENRRQIGQKEKPDIEPQIHNVPQLPKPLVNETPSSVKSFSLKKNHKIVAKTTQKNPVKKIKLDKTKFSYKLPFLTLILTIILLVASPIIGFAFEGYQLTHQLKSLEEGISNNDFSSISLQIDKINKQSKSLQNRIISYYQPLDFVLGQSRVENLAKLSQLLEYLTQTGESLSQAAEYGSRAAMKISGQEQGNPDQELRLAETRTTEAYHYLSLSQALLEENPDLSKITFLGIDTYLKELKQNLPQLRKHVYQAQQLLKSAPEIIGENDRKVYLILLQNNMELRPTGGFIGSYATLIFENGKLLDLQVEDVYTADGQLKGYVKPPEPIEKYLGEASWFLRDSNWDPDFPTTAETASWFLEKEMGTKVDGVIGVNLQVVQALLEVLGPIELPDYQETITSENLYERLQYQSEINFFPGSTQKKDYLGQLTRIIYHELLQSDAQNSFSVGKAIINSANNKQLTISLSNQKVSDVFRDLGWSGAIVKPECQTDSAANCINDYFGFREANVGVNKANYFVHRAINHQVTLTQNETVHKVTLTLENTATSDAWPGGTYRNYLRAYTPKNAQINQILVDNNLVNLDEVDQSYEFEKSVWGLITATKPGDKTTVTLTYTIPTGLSIDLISSYQLYLQKQPGTGADSVTTTITYPGEYQVAKTNFASQKTDNNKLDINDSLDTDKSYLIEFVR